MALSSKQTSEWLPGRRHGNRPFEKHKRLLPFRQEHVTRDWP